MAGIPYPALPLADVCFSYFLGFSALEGKRPSRFHPLPPALWMGACRISERILPVGCFYRDSHGEGKGVSARGESMPGIDFLSCWYMVKGDRKEVTLVPWGSLSDRKCSCKTIIQWGEPSPFQYIIPFSHCILYRLC